MVERLSCAFPHLLEDSLTKPSTMGSLPGPFRVLQAFLSWKSAGKKSAMTALSTASVVCTDAVMVTLPPAALRALPPPRFSVGPSCWMETGHTGSATAAMAAQASASVM